MDPKILANKYEISAAVGCLREEIFFVTTFNSGNTIATGLGSQVTEE